MSNQFSDFLIKERPASQRFWVVRASGGQYVRHFREASLVGIGHINKLDIKDTENFDEIKIINIEQKLRIEYPDRPKNSITSHTNQIKNFVAVLKDQDMVITIDSNHLMIGIVESGAYISNEPVVLTTLNNKWSMSHKLRRRVQWGPILERATVPLALEMALFAHQTVFNIDDHWASIYHLLYPCFKFKSQLYLSASINQSSDIDNYSVSQFFALLSGVEAVGAALASSKTDLAYGEIINSYRAAEAFSLTTRASFMSEGTAWSTAKMQTGRMIWTALVYVMLFGGDMHVVKAEGVITKEMREKAWVLVLEMAKTHDLDKIKDNLKIKIPQVDTRSLDNFDNRTT